MMHLGVFALAFAVDALWIAWFHYSERNRAGMSAIVSMAVALPSVVGIGATLHDWHYGPAYVLGLGAGSYVSVWWKSRRVRQCAVRPIESARAGSRTRQRT